MLKLINIYINILGENFDHIYSLDKNFPQKNIVRKHQLTH